jgi:NAD(P)-dependent dehydrogenase (short-subunit alcohol dehydrogenase family)
VKQAALVTGASKRIGLAIAGALAGRGYDIAMHYGKSREQAQASADKIKAMGVDCRLFQADLSQFDQVAALAAGVVEAMPHCTVLVNSAAIFERAGLAGTDEAILNRHFAINFKAPFFLTRDLAAFWAKNNVRANIVNILDTRITRQAVAHFAYTLSKKALYDFTKMAAKDLAPLVRVNGVCPGLILEPPGKDAAYLDKLVDTVPLKRRGSPADIAGAVMFLLDNDYITGQCIFVDGGESVK